MAIKPPVHLALSTDNFHDNLLHYQQQKSQLSQYVKSMQEFQSAQTITNPYQIGMTSTSISTPKFDQNKLLESAEKKKNQKHLSGSKSNLSLRNIDGARHSMLESTFQSGFVGLRGRPFTVSKVGNNGKIYLRPKVLPVRESISPSTFTPISPKTADNKTSTPLIQLKKSQNDNSAQNFSSSELHDIPKDSKFINTRSEIFQQPLSIPGMYAPRADETKKYTGKSDKKSTHIHSDQTNSLCFPTLQVSIPSYRLDFDPIDGSSSQRPDSTISSTPSLENTGDLADVSSSTLRHFASKRESENYAPPNLSFVDLDQLDNASLQQEVISRGSSIVPEMFDKLMLRPLCEHPTVVQYTVTRQISAATPARLVAEITSPSFVDYSLLSDFFLTFRSFLGTSQLLKMLIARLKWALLKKDSTGTVVRVRTFVALRHWLLNYFVDDFLMDFELRKLFCELLNDFVEQIMQNPQHSQIPFQITGELKKCWRIVCATFWDSADFHGEMDPLAPIYPGEYFDTNTPKIEPKFWTSSYGRDTIDESEPISSEIKIKNENTQLDHSQLDAEVSQFLSQKCEELNKCSEEKLHLPKILISEDEAHTVNTDYLGSESLNHTGSYSAPYKSSQERNHNLSQMKNTELRAWNFKQNARFSDSYRGCNFSVHPAHKIRYHNTDLLTTFPPASAILRANLFPPGQPFVDMRTPLTPTGNGKEVAIPQGARVNHRSQSAISGPGMKKLLGNMRRALRDRAGQFVSSQHTQGCLPHVSLHVNRSSNISGAPDLADSLKRHTRNVPSDISMRIDFLGVEVAKDFKEALEESSGAKNSDRIHQEFKLLQHTTEESGPQDTIFKSFMGSQSSLLAFGSSENLNESSNKTLSSPATNKFLQPIPLVTAEALDSPTTKTRPNTRLQPSCEPTPPITPPSQSPSSFIGITTPNFQNIFEKYAWNQTLSVENNLSHCIDTDLRENQKNSGQSVKAISVGQALETPTTNSAKSRKQLTSFQSNITRWTHERSFDATTISGSEFGEHEKILDLTSIPSLLRPLRRRPGCNLRSVNNLEAPEINLRDAASSTDSWASEVSKSLYSLHPSNSQYDDDVEKFSRNLSLGQLAGPHQEVINSALVAPESLENGAYILAQIPDDDDDDDGGIESTLLKLEGRFQKRNLDSARNKNSVDAHRDTHPRTLSKFSTLPAEEEEGRETKSIQGSKTDPMKLISVSDNPQFNLDMDKLRQGFDASPAYRSQLDQYTQSIESRSLYSRPEKDTSCCGHLSDYGSREAFDLDQHEQNTSNLLYTPELSHGNTSDSALESDEVDEHQSKASTINSLSWAHADDRDLISPKFWENSSPNEYENFDLKSTTGNLFSSIESCIKHKEHAHPLFEPLSSSMKMSQALEISPEASYFHSGLRIRESSVPENSPDILFGKETEIRSPNYPINPLRSHRITESYKKTPPHMPFILAHDSDILAQQFTLVEKDALNEIDWKDLIEIQCGNHPSEIRSWVKFLRSKNTPQGIEIIMTRFNLMVKWAVSECVLIQNISKRVDCLVKFIHIAESCRKRRNFATMTQITTALISRDLAELTHTWSHISSSDIKMLEELKTLILPSQNFHNLRAEMEGASADQGCIPFLGVYIEELASNHQNPIFMETSSTMEPLVNFERCRTDAMIIKTLLRLIEASQRYTFSPIEGVIERCIWIAALSDEEIANYRKLIEG